MRHRAGYHTWMDPEPIADGRARSLCSECGLVVEHSASRRPGELAAGRIIAGKPLKATEHTPTCGDAPRQRYPRRHLWQLVGEAPPTPRGAKCDAYVCTRCGMHVETLASCSPGSIGGRYSHTRHRMPGEPWANGKLPRCHDCTDDEVKAYVAEHMGNMTARKMAKVLGRSQGVIRHRVKQLSAAGMERHKHHCEWTEDDIFRLVSEWRPTDVRSTAKVLKRSPTAVVTRARMMGLVDHRGCPQGYEYLSDAETRLGFSIAELETIIRWANLKFIRAIQKDGKRIARTRVYCADHLTEAVDEWLKTCNVGQYCVSISMRLVTMRRWLALRGIVQPEGTTPQSWRLPISLLDEVAEEAREMWSPNRYATERGVSVASVQRRCLMLGIGKGRRFHVADMDQAFRIWPIQVDKIHYTQGRRK